MSFHYPRAPLSLFVLFLLFSRLAAASDWRVAPVSSLHKLTATAPGTLEPFTPQPAQLRAARGEWESFQIVVTAGERPLHNVRLETPGLASFRGGAIAREQFRFFREHFVYVAQPSGNRRIEKLWWPDALIPLSPQFRLTIPAHQSAVFWIALRVPHETLPGEYSGAIRIRSDSGEELLPVALTVEPIALPAPTLRANVAVYYDVLRDWYAKNVAPQDDAHFARLKRQYYEFLLDYRLNAYDLPVAWNSTETARYLRDDRVLSVRLPPLDDADFDTALATLRENEALQKAYFYRIDEPPPQRFDEVRETTQRLHAIDPALRHCVTIHPNAELEGFADIWCPNIGDFFGLGHLDFQWLQRERDKGRETWWYTMVEPKYPYPTWLLDDDAVAVRLYGWLMARHGITGFVYSMAHGWGPNPYENLQSFAGTNGDGTLLYPGELAQPPYNGPLPSIRLMLLRDAIEDYELLRALPPSQRENVTRAIVGDGLLRRRDDAALWQSGRPRALLLDAACRNDSNRSDSNRSDSLSPWRVPPSRAIKVDGVLRSGEWKNALWFSPFQRVPGEFVAGSELHLAHDGESLFVALRGRLHDEPRGEWSALEIAPEDATVRWRFVVTAKGNAVVEKHTREGHFRIEDVEWQHALSVTGDSYVVEMRVPLAVIGAPQTFRCNALQKVYYPAQNAFYLARAFPDAGDTQRMPFFVLD